MIHHHHLLLLQGGLLCSVSAQTLLEKPENGVLMKSHRTTPTTIRARRPMKSAGRSGREDPTRTTVQTMQRRPRLPARRHPSERGNHALRVPGPSSKPSSTSLQRPESGLASCPTPSCTNRHLDNVWLILVPTLGRTRQKWSAKLAP
ncbi:hypothetical protein CTA2_2777 [Colletotrichum tanaceti]|nr:hypothetical protein CTA2_2777 [Colletotrichum tanaceti]